MTGTPLTHRLTALLAAGAILAGCGGSSGSSGSGGSGLSVPGNVLAKCEATARKLSDSTLRNTALQACRAAKSGKLGGLKQAARKECLAAARQIPVASARKIAEDVCHKGTK